MTVTEVADHLLAKVPAERWERPFFPVSAGVKAGPELYGALLASAFAEIVPKPGEELALGFTGYYPDVERRFDPAWPIEIVGERWGPYSDGYEGYKAVKVVWRSSVGSTVVSLGVTDAETFDLSRSPLEGNGLGRSTWMAEYAETGYEGHGHKSADGAEEFMAIIEEHLQ